MRHLLFSFVVCGVAAGATFGEDRALQVVAEKRDARIEKFVEYASAKPVAGPQRRPPRNANTTAAPAKTPGKK